jgi:hypothetical protein
MDRIARGMTIAARRPGSGAGQRQGLKKFLTWAKGAAQQVGNLLRGSPEGMRAPDWERTRRVWPKDR